MMDEYEKRREKEIKREMYYVCENITLLKKRLVVLREELLSLGDNKDKELENGKVKKLTYKRKKYQNNREKNIKIIEKNILNKCSFYFNPYCVLIYNL